MAGILSEVPYIFLYVAMAAVRASLLIRSGRDHAQLDSPIPIQKMLLKTLYQLKHTCVSTEMYLGHNPSARSDCVCVCQSTREAVPVRPA